MNGHKGLTWVLLYISIIYPKNVVYSTESGTDQSLSTISSDPSSTSQPSEPNSTASVNNEATTSSGSSDSSQGRLATSTDPSQASSTKLTDQSQPVLSESSPSNNLNGLKLFTVDKNGNRVDLDQTLYEYKFLFKGRTVLVCNLKNNANCSSVAVEDKVIWSRDNSETPIGTNNEKEYPNKIFYTIPSPEFEESHNHIISYTPAKHVFVVFDNKHLRYMILCNKWVLQTNQDVPADEFNEFVKEAKNRANAITQSVPQKALEVTAQPDEHNEPKTQTAKTDSQSSGTSSNQPSSGYTLDVVTTSHDNTKYDHETKNNDVIFTFKTNVNCTEVKCNNVEVWKTGDQNINKPKSVKYNSNDNTITVGDDKSSVIYNKKSDGSWYHFTTVNIESDVTSAGEDASIKQTESSSQPDQGSTTVVTTPEQTSTSPDISSSKADDSSSTNETDASQPESGSTHTSGLGEVLLSSIYPTSSASSYVWDVDSHGSSGSSTDPSGADSSSKSSSQPAEASTTKTKKTADSSGSALTGQSASAPPAVPAVPSGGSTSGQGTRTDQSGGAQQASSTQAPKSSPQQQSSGESAGEGARTAGQSQASSSPTSTSTDDTSKQVKKTGVELSLKDKKATDQFDYKKEDKVVTFTAKDKYAFKSVKTKKGSSCGSGGSDLTIWEAENASEYASKVVLEGKGDKNNKVVTIHLANGSKKVFTRGGSDKAWIEHTTENLLTIYTKDPNDPGKTIELDHNKIKPVGDKGDNKLYKYEFGEQVQCIEVKYSDESVWKHGNHGTQEHPKFIFYHELVKIVFVEVPKDTFHFYRKKLSDKKWAHEELKSTDKVDKDKVKLYTDSSGKNELATDKYIVKEFPFGFEFALKEGSNCKLLKYESKKFTFEPDRSDKYPVNLCFLNNKHCIVVYKSRASYKAPDS